MEFVILLEWFMKRTSWHESFVLEWNCTVCAVRFWIRPVWTDLYKKREWHSVGLKVYIKVKAICSSLKRHMNIRTQNMFWFSSLVASSSKSNIWPCEHFTNSPTSPLVICTDSDKVLAVILMSKYVCYWSRAGPLTANRALVFRTVSCVAFANAYTDWLIRNQAFAPCRVICVNDICKLCLLLLGASASSSNLDLFPLCGKHSGG